MLLQEARGSPKCYHLSSSPCRHHPKAGRTSLHPSIFFLSFYLFILECNPTWTLQDGRPLSSFQFKRSTTKTQLNPKLLSPYIQESSYEDTQNLGMERLPRKQALPYFSSAFQHAHLEIPPSPWPPMGPVLARMPIVEPSFELDLLIWPLYAQLSDAFTLELGTIIPLFRFSSSILSFEGKRDLLAESIRLQNLCKKIKVLHDNDTRISISSKGSKMPKCWLHVDKSYQTSTRQLGGKVENQIGATEKCPIYKVDYFETFFLEVKLNQHYIPCFSLFKCVPTIYENIILYGDLVEEVYIKQLAGIASGE